MYNFILQSPIQKKKPAHQSCKLRYCRNLRGHFFPLSRHYIDFVFKRNTLFWHHCKKKSPDHLVIRKIYVLQQRRVANPLYLITRKTFLWYNFPMVIVAFLPQVHYNSKTQIVTVLNWRCCWWHQPAAPCWLFLETLRCAPPRRPKMEWHSNNISSERCNIRV